MVLSDLVQCYNVITPYFLPIRWHSFKHVINTMYCIPTQFKLVTSSHKALLVFLATAIVLNFAIANRECLLAHLSLLLCSDEVVLSVM